MPLEDNLSEHKREIIHLMMWLVAHPPEQSSAYIREALEHCMETLHLSESEVKGFADQVKMAEIVLGDKLPDDPKGRAVYKTFMSYLLRIKNQ